jgi:hypothetical protein
MGGKELTSLEERQDKLLMYLLFIKKKKTYMIK